MAKDTFYFTHDYNSRNDEKIKSLLFKHGLLGYGIFWAIIEDLYNNSNVLQSNYERIAFELREDKTIVESVIKDFDLFVFEDGNFGSLSVQKRLEERNSKSIKARESVLKRWEKYERNTNELQTLNEGNTIKERKGKEIKESKVFTPPILSDVISYFVENGYTEQSAEKAFRYYNDAGWKDSKGNKVKNWKQKMQGVWFKDENKKAVAHKTKRSDFTDEEWNELSSETKMKIMGVCL